MYDCVLHVEKVDEMNHILNTSIPCPLKWDKFKFKLLYVCLSFMAC